MVFCDQDVTGYVLCLALPGSTDVFPVEVQMDMPQGVPDATWAYDRIGQAVVDYLNDGVLLGVVLQDSASPEQKANFRKHLPTVEEEDFLRQFLDEVVVTNDIAEAMYFAEDNVASLNCTLRLHIEEGENGTLLPTIRYGFERVYNLFLFECYELLKDKRLKKCQLCGRYFFPGKSKAKFCSDSCRSKSHTTNSSDEYKAYRRANDAKHKQFSSGQISQKAYDDWQNEAKEARTAYTQKELTWSEYETVLKQNLRQK